MPAPAIALNPRRTARNRRITSSLLIAWVVAARLSLGRPSPGRGNAPRRRPAPRCLPRQPKFGAAPLSFSRRAMSLTWVKHRRACRHDDECIRAGAVGRRRFEAGMRCKEVTLPLDPLSEEEAG